MGYLVMLIVGLLAFAMLMFAIAVILEPKGEEGLSPIEKDRRKCSFYKKMRHLGGHPSFLQDELVVFKVRDGEMFIADYLMNKHKRINFNNLIDYKIQNETEISKDVTVPRVLALGVLALAAKKETKTINQFLTLTLKENGVEFQCVFGKDNKLDDLHSIITEINRLKLESAKN